MQKQDGRRTRSLRRISGAIYSGYTHTTGWPHTHTYTITHTHSHTNTYTRMHAQAGRQTYPLVAQDFWSHPLWSSRTAARGL